MSFREQTRNQTINENIEGKIDVGEFSQSQKLDIKGGAKSLAGRYLLPATKSIARATVGTVTGLSGAMLGFAGGVAQGDLGKAFSGAAAGGATGAGIGKAGVDFASNIGGNVKKSVNNLKDTWNEGAYGTEYAQNIRMMREFKETKEYKELRDEFGDNLTDEKLSEILNAARKEQESTKK